MSTPAGGNAFLHALELNVRTELILSLGGAPSGLRQRQVVPELPAGADAELGEHLVQVVLRGTGADEQPGADLRVGVALGGEPGDLRLLHGEGIARVHGALADCLTGGLEFPAGPFGEPRGPNRPNMSWAARRCSRASARRCSRRSHSPHTRWARARWTAIRLRARRSIASRYRVSAAGPSLSSARDRAWMPSAHSDPAARVRSLSCRRAADASSLAPPRAPASTSSARDHPKKPRSSYSHARRAPRIKPDVTD